MIPVSQQPTPESEHLEALNRMRTLGDYYRWTYSLLAPYIGTRTIEVGCGIGNFTELLHRTSEYVLAIDISPQNLEVVRRRFGESSKIELAALDLESAEINDLRRRDIDTIVCLDILEHLEDDCRLLRLLAGIVEHDAKLLVKVPACPWLFGSVDIASHHYRRYTPQMIRERVLQSGWTPILTQYMNIFGVFPYWLKSVVLRRKVNFSNTFSDRQLNLLQAALPSLQRLDRLIGPPIGQSVILVASKTA